MVFIQIDKILNQSILIKINVIQIFIIIFLKLNIKCII